MAKEVKTLVKLQIPAGKANPAPPVGPALGQHGVNIMEFCKQFNAKTQSQEGSIIPVIITVYTDRSFTFVMKTPPASDLLKKAAGIIKGSGVPKRSDPMVRGSAVLPHGTGVKVRILVFAKGEKEKEARDAGADIVGGEELVEKIKGGWLEFDRAIATPDMMGTVGKLGKILGPRGLMPNPKTGTVTFEVAKAINDIRKGRVEYKVEKAGILHVRVGKVSFEAQKLYENALAILESVLKAKPSTSKGRYLKSVTLSSTMGPGVSVDTTALSKKLAA